MDERHEKLHTLKSCLRELGNVAVAFSAGIDSTFLLQVARDTLGDNVIAVTSGSRFFPLREQAAAEAFCAGQGIPHFIVTSDELEIPGFRENPPRRCYLCKHALFSRILQVAAEKGARYVVEGSNVDDLTDYRPGMKALAELGVQSPLLRARLTKADIRALAKEMGLPVWDKPSFACLATRFVYGERITEEKLARVDRAEQRLLDMGFHQVRVRIHGEMARIEIQPSEFSRIVQPEISGPLTRYLRELGFLYVTLDLEGYQTGSMNRVLPDFNRRK